MPQVANSAKNRDLPSRNVSLNSLIPSLGFWLCLGVLILVPLAFTPAIYRTFSLLKFLVLLTGTAALVPLVAHTAMARFRNDRSERRMPGVSQIALVSAYLVTIAVSTAFGAAPVASFVGSFENQMGLVTRVCFYVYFLALIFGIGQSRTRLMQSLWVMLLTGLVAATYAFVQFFGRDPFLPLSTSMFSSRGEPIIRAAATLGHADYLGNFLLYTTPLAMAMALIVSGRARRLAVVAAGVSTAAIAFTGTRGAWVGLTVGAIVFIASELRGKSGAPRTAKRHLRTARIVTVCSIVAISVWVIASNAASHNISARARLFVTEGFTGSGRTLLWRDSLRMAPSFVFFGCGPEGFRKTFLRYKSKELARLAPDINNESSHNSYLDAALSFGLPGAVLYVAIIASTFLLLLKARRQTGDRKLMHIITGLLSSFAAVSTHNLFIFDQIPTGLYFFCFVALAFVVANIASVEGPKSKQTDIERSRPHTERVTRKESARANTTAVWPIVLSGAAFLASGCYSLLALRADSALKGAFAAANEGKIEQVIRCVNDATAGFDPASDYDFAAARAFTLCAEHLGASIDTDSARIQNNDALRSRTTAVELAIAHANKSLARTLTPDSSYLLLAYLALLAGDSEGISKYATEAVKWDPYFPNARWLMAEAFLAQGDRDQAKREAEMALEISPSLSNAKSALERARGESETNRRGVERSIERARQSTAAGNPARAEFLLHRAIERSPAQCAECHRQLALLYEASNRYEFAIAEWETFMHQATDRTSAEQAASHIQLLRQKSGLKR